MVINRITSEFIRKNTNNHYLSIKSDGDSKLNSSMTKMKIACSEQRSRFERYDSDS